MLFRFLLLSLTYLFFALNTWAQQYTISGYIKDSTSGETLLGANIIDALQPNFGASSNVYGFYSITLPAGEYKFVCSYIGYENKIFSVILDSDKKINMELIPNSIVTKEIVITGVRSDENVQSTQMGTVEVPVEKIKKLPALMGEVDILKTLQLLPGIKNGGDGNNGFYVRGGGADQNLILLDDAVVYNTGHMLGFFSVFNADAIKNTTVIKGNMPAQYGGRLSSVLDITMKEGNNKHWELEGGIGAISSRITVQGPLQKNKSSFIVSARRTYVFDLVKPIIDTTSFAGTNYFFYDLNAKANYILSDVDRVYLSGYFGRDRLTYKSADRGFAIDIPYGNTTGTLRWNHLINDQLFMNISAVYNDYNFKFLGEQDAFLFELFSGIKDWNVKVDFDYSPNVNHTVKFGTSYTHHTFTPTSATGQAGDVEFESKDLRKYAHEAAIFFEDDMVINDNVKINAGLRVPFFQQIGPYDRILYNELQTPYDTIKYIKNKSVKTYTGIEPRINFRYSINPNSSIKGGFSINNQFIHLVTGTASTLPTDLWVPSTINVKPQIGIQYALGFFKNLKDNMFESSIEVYYKKMYNQIEYKDGAVPELNYDIEERFTFGKGEAYGAEFFLRKNKGKLTGWIGYTLANTTRFFADLNNGRSFPASYDRTHDISVVGMYNLNARWELSSSFIYYTGRAFTLPTGRYFVNNWFATEYTDRNAYRLIPYHRIDIGITWKSNPSKRFKHSITLAAYNAYNRKNQDFIYFDTDIDNGTFSIKAYQVSIFPIIPSITWNFKI